MTRIDPDAPYQRLAALPRTLWLPAVTNSAGETAQRLADLARWRAALQAGTLPDRGADFGDRQAERADGFAQWRHGLSVAEIGAAVG